MQWIKEGFAKQRKNRLAEPADPSKSTHGQGKYLTEARKDRSIITKKTRKGNRGNVEE